MDRQRLQRLLVRLPALVPRPPDHTHHIVELITRLMVINLPRSPSAGIRFRNFAEDENEYAGRDVFTLTAVHRYQFYQFTGETPETLCQLTTLLSIEPGRDHMLRNRTLLFMIWARTYPTYHVLATMFGVSVGTVSLEVRHIIPLIYDKLRHFVVWPTVVEWLWRVHGPNCTWLWLL